MDSGYIPGQIYDASKGITREQFENEYALSAPMERGFFNDPAARAGAIIIVNLSSCTFYSVLDDPDVLNPAFPAYRENQVEEDGVLLPRGQATHYNVDPERWHVHISQYTEGEQGDIKYLTGKGYLYTELEDMVLSVVPGETSGLDYILESAANLNKYALIDNRSGDSIALTITKDTTTYPLSQEELDALLSDRTPDMGGEPDQVIVIENGAQWHLDVPPTYYTVRALQAMGGESQPERSKYIVVKKNVAPPKSGYGEYANAVARARAGNVVVYTDGENDLLEATVYDMSQIRPVNPNIVVTA
jgi:hypothetical protein